MENFVQANTNGRLHDAGEPSISPIDRGFLYGDAIYEVWRTYDGVIFAFDEHWERLLRSATALYLPMPLSRDDLLAEISRTAGAFRERTGSTGELYVRLQVTRGAGSIGLDPALARDAVWVVLVQDLLNKVSFPRADGLRLSIAQKLRRNPVNSLNPAWKTGNYLNNLLCLEEARGRGADEVLILNEGGFICEASVCNVFFVRDGDVVTPPFSAGLLGGVTRALLLEKVGQHANVSIREADVRPEDLNDFAECFLTSSTRDIIPVGSIDRHSYTTGTETVSQKLKAAFGAYAADYALKHRAMAI